MDQVWFELGDVRKRRLEGSVWIPLRAIHSKMTSGKSGHIGYREEFFGAGSVAVFGKHRNEAETLGWTDIGISNEHAGCIQDGRYVPSDVYESYEGIHIGMHLVLEQRVNKDEVREWYLHQDLVLAFGLKREGDTWVAPNIGYIEVARLHRDQTKKPYLLELRAEYLKDYLCARDMALYVTSYWNREEVVASAEHVTWPENPFRESGAGDRWEGRIMPIHEGGHPFGAETAVFHVSRTDVDPHEDVPTFGISDNDSVASRSWTETHEGQKVFRIQGELWRNEWVEPGAQSPRIRGDELPPSVFFISDAAGQQESKTTLVKGSRWLWFRPDVVMALAHRRGGGLHWYTRDTGAVRCSPDYDVHFGINAVGLVNVYAKDIALLPDWQQRIWAGHNVGPEGGVSDELLASQMKADPAETQAPEDFLERGLVLLNEAASKTHGIEFVREHEHRKHLLSVAHRFRAVDQAGFFALAKDLARLTADSFDSVAMQRIVSPPKGTQWRSLKSLENLVALHTGAESAHQLVGPLFGIYELRHPDAHLPSSNLSEAYRLADVDQSRPLVFQAYQMLDSCVATLWSLAKILEQPRIAAKPTVVGD
ncbi:MAG: hypothetical protein IID53_11815 [Proteobacteria bacterium]|nr:hypothetical protein [Pseudomonadota bacterium]